MILALFGGMLLWARLPHLPLFSVPAGAWDRASSWVAQAGQWGGFSEGTYRRLLEQTLPVAPLSEDEDEAAYQGLAQTAFYALTGVRLNQPSLLQAQVPVWMEGPPEEVSPPLSPPPSPPPPSTEPQPPAPSPQPAGEDKPGPEVGDSQKPLVLIYNTHNAEAYRPSEGADRLEGKAAGITKVAKRLADTLRQKYKIPVVLSSTIHDYPHWELAYTRSAKTVAAMLAKYPSIQVVIDIHRDAALGQRRSVTIQGKPAAPVLFVVGTDQRLKHPHWKENQEFAEKLAAKINLTYPGLLRGVRVQDGRYNQHLHPHAILIEVGSAANSLEEAYYSAELLARVLKGLIEADLGQKVS